MSSNKIFSKALFLENLRRFWVMDLAAFFLYFLSGPIQIISNSGELSYYTVETYISSCNPGFLAFGAYLPVIAAVTVFSYLNKTGSTCVMHAMPFSRKKLFCTNYISGLVIASLPLILACIVLLCFVQPIETTGYGAGEEIYSVIKDIEVYSAASVLRTFAAHFINILFIYSLAVLACVLSGNGVIAVLTAGAFNLLAPSLYICMLGYANRYLYGFDSEKAFEPILNMHPVFQCVADRVVNGELSYSWKYMALYILISCAVSIAAYYLYKLRPLETAGDSYSFDAMAKFVVICITFLFSSAFGLVFMEVSNTEATGYFVLILTAIAGFVIGQMLAKKSFHIFNREGFKLMAVSLAFVIAVMLAFSCDILGFEKRIPSRGNIEHVEISCWNLFVNNDDGVELYDAENIDAAYAFNKEIIAERKENEAKLRYSYDPYDVESVSYDYGKSITFTYVLKDGSTFSRSYSVPLSFLIESENLRIIQSSDEILSGLYALRDLDLSNAEMIYSWYDYNEEICAEEQDEFLEDESLEYTEYDYTEYDDSYRSEALPSYMFSRIIEALIADEISIGAPEYDADYEYVGEIELSFRVKSGIGGIDLTRETLNEKYRNVYGFDWVEQDLSEYECIVYFRFTVTESMTKTLALLP